MAAYLVHRSRERARIRHQALAVPATQAQVFEFLKGLPGVAGVKPGNASFLLLLEPSADLDEICAELEGAFFFFRDGARPAQAADQAPAGPVTCNLRHLGHMALLTCGLTTVVLALTGLKHAHVWAGCFFTLLATDHVWKRRKAL